jgi:hypothetical protein
VALDEIFGVLDQFDQFWPVEPVAVERRSE